MGFVALPGEIVTRGDQQPNTPRKSERPEFQPRYERSEPVPSARPLYPVRCFGDTKVDRLSAVARFGGYLFAVTERGWEIVMHYDVPGAVDHED